MSPSPSHPLSPTQRDLREIEIARYVREAFGPDAEIVAVTPLSGGGFASVTRIDLADGRRLELYRLHLHLVMTVEMPSRGMTRDNETWRFDRLEALLRECVDVIES